MNKLKLLLLSIIATVACTAASAPVVVQGPVLPWRVQVDLNFDEAGAVSSAVPQVFFRQTITIDGEPVRKSHGSVTWDSVAKKDEPVSIKLADGSIVQTTRGAVLAAVLTIAETERQALSAPPN